MKATFKNQYDDILFFVENSLRVWKKEVPEVEFIVSYSTSSEFYVIEVIPEEVRRGSHKSREQERKFLETMLCKLPDKDFLVCEENENERGNIVLSLIK